MTDVAAQQVGILIVDDHQMVAESLGDVLDGVDGLGVVGIATTGDDALRMARAHRPDVVAVDYRMPGRDGTEIARELRAELPDAVLIMLTAEADDRLIAEAVRAGCAGVVTKDRPASSIVEAIQQAVAGTPLISPDVLIRILPHLSGSARTVGDDLTPREHDVLRRLAVGETTRTIAEELFLSVNTIRNYVQSILTKLGAHSKLEAVSIAVREGLVEIPRQA